MDPFSSTGNCPAQTGSDAGARHGSPIDLAHLDAQTMGDVSLRAEVLALFVQQADDLERRMPSSRDDEQRRLAHTLVGSARGIGAFAVADRAACIEKLGFRDDLGRHLALALEEARSFIASIGR